VSAATPTEKILIVEGLTKRFGGLTAVSDVDLTVSPNEIVGLIGPNGAGKTTLFALISGFLRPDSGHVSFEGEDITGMRPYKIARRGLVRTFQLVQPFPAISTLENVMIGSFTRESGQERAREEARTILNRVGLGTKADTPAEGINLGESKKLEVARALATRPRLLLLDEVMAGLNPTETAEIIELVRQLAAEGVTVVLIEHVMRAVMTVCSRIIVLHHGAKIAEGSPGEIAEDPRVVEAYLGDEVLLA
jgi:branched-chain amino acid transport system ATP-binding protein